MIFPVKRLADLGFEILATEGTAEVLRRNGVEADGGAQAHRGRGADGEPTIVELIHAGEIDLVVNTPSGPSASARADGYEIRAADHGDGHAEHHHGAAARPPRCRASRRMRRGDLDVALAPGRTRPRSTWLRRARPRRERGPLQVARRGLSPPAGSAPTTT